MNDYFGYSGKVCVVTGAASGMGKATAEMLVDLGAKVYALDTSPISIDGLEKAIRTDLSQKESIDQAFKEIPAHIDSYFGIAGISGRGTDFVTTVKIDLISNKYICDEILIDRMSKGGSIAFITSTAGNGWENDGNKTVYLPVLQTKGWDEAVEYLIGSILAHLPGTLGYPFSKLAMNYLTVQLQAVYAPKGIRVNAVLPGSTDTGLKADFTQMIGGEENLIHYTGYAQRLAESREMAGPIVFLNSEMASYISGERLAVDFGCTAELVAGITEPVNPINLSAILEYMKSQTKQ